MKTFFFSEKNLKEKPYSQKTNNDEDDEDDHEKGEKTALGSFFFNGELKRSQKGLNVNRKSK